MVNVRVLFKTVDFVAQLLELSNRWTVNKSASLFQRDSAKTPVITLVGLGRGLEFIKGNPTEKSCSVGYYNIAFIYF